MATLAVPSSSYSSSHSHGYSMASTQYAPSSSNSAAGSVPMVPSGSSHSSTGTTSTKATKLRSHLLSLLPLLPKHALFHAKLTIHEVASVPFLDGEFATKWRFKNAHSVAGAAASANAHAHAAGQAGPSSTGNLVERAAAGVRRMGSYSSLRGHSAASLDEDSPESSSSSSDRERTQEARGGRTTPMPGDPPPTPPQHPAAAASRPGTSHSQYGAYLSPAYPSYRPALSAASSYYQNPPPTPGSLNFVSQPKGQTAYVPLRKHAAVWSLDVDAAVQMSIGRSGGGPAGSGDSQPGTPGFASPSTGAGGARAQRGDEGEKEPGWLQPCELKLTVVKYLQEWERKDELARDGAVLGTVVLNLAEYVGEGGVTRRYLLRDSKTNATLKLSIELTQIGGETRYRSPPLQKGQILGSVAGLISDDHMRRHARSPLLRAASSGSSSSSLTLPPTEAHPQGYLSVQPPAGHRRTPSTQSVPAASSAPHSAHPMHLAAPHPHLPAPSYPSPSRSPAPPSSYPYSPSFAPSPSHPSPGPSPQHPQSTESIIEALFNPFPSQSNIPSPFTYYKPPAPAPGPADPSAAAADGSEVGDEEGTGGEDGSTADESGKGKQRKWWRKGAGQGERNTLKKPQQLDLRGAKGRSDTMLAMTPQTAALSGVSGASTVTPGTARPGTARSTTNTGKWKWR